MSVLLSPKRLTVNGTSIRLREEVHPADLAGVRRITESGGFFTAPEIDIAIELVQSRLSQGLSSGYYFLFADAEAPVGESVGYSCFGPIPCTQASFDLYWIAVHDRFRGQGLGKLLLEESETMIRRLGGKRIYVETSSRSLYEPTRSFYIRGGYTQEAMIPDFYAPGDGKIIYGKELK